MVRQYLEIEQVRCGDRLNINIDLAPESVGCRIPPLILQPLVENAVRHGIQSLVEGGELRIVARSSQGRLCLSVDNPFDPESPSRRGARVGLANVKKRLRTLYGNDQSVVVDSTADTFHVELEVPCVRVSEEKKDG